MSKTGTSGGNLFIVSLALVILCIGAIKHEASIDKHHCHDKAHNINVEQERE